MRRGIKSALATAAVAAAASLAMGTASASAAPVTAPQAQEAKAASACGWYTDWTAHAWYNHCGTGRVVIYVDLLSVGGSSEGYETCVGPGDTYLGSWPAVQGAWYVGRTC
ncbi:DUF6355 family natural product biosynthesis protein [Streptomyces sp. TS71-3]|uniref:DUF6355 family natural product biosynthesis protein n=1 Tax=Streptomyces sp. TS71-3 TaxID=2733862 RepID=UPI001B1E830E|nr:DUF6355 family natural product biosynthesis protein [Streptomyces sp. TS71-3]GHJ38074.1 hypothetical protein Sm713_36830 [Streptomyces sp. TS71-3]